MRRSGPLRVTGLEVRYHSVVALRDIGFTVPPGGMLAVTGPSGAGKSSLLWALAGATTHAGRVTVDGTPVVDRADAARRGITLIPQGNGLPSFLTAQENVLVPLLATGASVADARLRSQEALTRVGLEQFTAHLVEELSGGQQQRVAVARSLAMQARVVLADEPTSDLDATNRQRMIRALRDEADAGATVIMATHDAESAAELDAELRLDDGLMRWRRPPTTVGWDHHA